uniref:Uncharacterized protein n=1 Tax=Chromera velia CCMP2878 TaxID=1169474 RepID=A0A0G4H9N7_9ALVE|eukprot:Cvel_6017.t1-p1 / transcript=Cvel_6017.t1 / gene=Cvel_6017 / organism=Chromera_velia_CCMP2878 / gene_product=hypothetical protein / transcript_product=hypothetical protein / location=Cvel_scaffold288:56710-61473(-) / protein_length=942 / sequence_SO=supercontig / SO=protein_coding / is_pseudo=false
METADDASMGICVPALSAIFTHTSAPAELISKLASEKAGFGTGWLVLQFIKQMQIGGPISSLDLSEFSLDAGKLGLLLSSLPAGPDFLETLKGGPHVCKGPCLSVLNKFLRGAASVSLKTLNLSKCDMSDSAGGTLLHSLPPSLEYLDVSENRLRSLSMEAVRSAFSQGTLSKLLGLDVSNNPLGPSGVATLARGLSASERALPLQSLKLSKTAAKAEGVKALSAPLKEGKAPSLQVLDLGGNDMRAEGVGGLAGAVGAGTLSSLRVLILRANCLAKKSKGDEWNFSSLATLFSHQFPALQELDFSENQLQGSADAATAASMVGEAFGGGRLPSVERLNLSGTQMRQTDVTAVCSALGTGSVPSLRVLHLCRVDVPAGEALAAALDSDRLPELRELVAQDDTLSEGMGVVTRSIASGKAPALSVLKMEVAYSTDPNTHVDDIWEGLAAGLRGGRLGSLEDLDLSFRYDEDDFPTEPNREFARALGAGALSSLRRLSLEWSEDSDEVVGALAESLGSGVLVSLEELCISVGCGEEEECKSLGEVLSTGKVPSLRKLELTWWLDESLEKLAQGLGVGSLSPDVAVDFRLWPTEEGDAALKAFAAIIRDRKVPGLRKLEIGEARPDDEGFIVEGAARDLGEALVHVSGEGRTASLSSPALEELWIDSDGFETEKGLSGLLSGIASGGGCLPSLHNLHINRLRQRDTPAAPPLAECITKGKFPKLRNLHFSSKSNPISLGQEGMQALALALCSPHAKSLRSLTLRSEETGNDRKAVGAEVAQMATIAVAFSSGQLTALEELSLEGELFTESVSALCVGLGSGKLRSLRSLELQRVLLHDDEGTTALCQALSAEKLPELRCLKLGGVNDAGLKQMVKAWCEANPPPLEKLDLSGSFVGVTDEGVLALIGLAGTGRVPILGDVRVGALFSSLSGNMQTVLKNFFPYTL